jgi:hypothetical protein
VFDGKQGELRQRYREGQEDQLGALGVSGQHDRSLEHAPHETENAVRLESESGGNRG